MRSKWPLLLLLSACAERPIADGDRVLVDLIPVGETQSTHPLAKITAAQYRVAMARMRLERDGSLDADPLPLDLKQLVLQRLIDQRLLAMEAEARHVSASTTAVEREILAMKRGFPKGDFQRLLLNNYQTEADLRTVVQTRLTAMTLLEQQILTDVEVPEGEITARWDQMPPEAKIRPRRVHAAQIVVRTVEEARQLEQALKRGEDFGTLAKKYSIAPEAKRGGDLGWFSQGELPAVFDEMCLGLKIDTISVVTPSEYGFHLCKVLAVEPERPLALDEVRGQLRQELQAERLRQAEANFIDSLRKKVVITRQEPLIAQLQGDR